MPHPQSSPRPLLLLADGRYDASAIMRLAHDRARANVARAAARGVVRRYAAALKCALIQVWESARTALYCAKRDAEMAALPAAHAAILAERTAALMIDSGRRMAAEVAAIEARASSLGILL